jgi:hypothetical protein
MPLVGTLQQRTAAGEFDVIWMAADRQYFEVSICHIQALRDL